MEETVISAKHVKKRRKIYKSALKVFAKKGFHNTKMQDVAEKANLGKGTLYWYFKSKEELFQFVIRCGFEEFNEAVLNAIAQVNHPMAKLKAAFEESLKFYFDNKDHIWVLTSFWSVSGLGKLNKRLRKEVNEEFEIYKGIIIGVLTNAARLGFINKGDNTKRAAHFTALIDGLLVHRVLGIYVDDYGKVEAEVYKEFLKGLKG